MKSEEFNKNFQIGTKVKYHPIIDLPECVQSKTRSVAWELPSGCSVVMIEKKAGGVSLDSLEIDRS